MHEPIGAKQQPFSGMKGVYENSGTEAGRWEGQSHAAPERSGSRLPAYWGIDAVMVPLCLLLTLLVVKNWDSILFHTASVIAYVLIGATIVLTVALIVAIILAIRNKRVW